MARAGFVEGFNGGIAPATDAEGWLKGQGFKDVTDTLPDARWAWPGDVIVYEYDAETIKRNNEKIKDALARYEQDRQDYLEKKKDYDKAHAEWTGRQKIGLSMLREGKEGKKDSKDPEPKPPKAPLRPQGENYGHIDVRTYDGYISDAKTLFLPNPIPTNRASKGMVVNGIYQKISDSVRDRILAFLKCIREWECHEEINDEKRYYYMYAAINGSRVFKDTSKHPFEGVESGNTPAGAYQIRLKTYKEHVIPKRDIPCAFTPEMQDRLAVRLIEMRMASGEVRGGKIFEALPKLVGEWFSLPGSKAGSRRERRNGAVYIYTEKDFFEKYEKFLQELK